MTTQQAVTQLICDASAGVPLDLAIARLAGVLEPNADQRRQAELEDKLARAIRAALEPFTNRP